MTSELIGYIPEDAEVREILMNENSDEIFYMFKANFRGIDMDVSISSYTYDGAKGTVKIIGSYCTMKCTDDDGKTVHVPYIYAVDISEVDDDTPLTNKVSFNIRITKTYKYLITEQGLELLFLFGTVLNVFNGIEVYKICLKGANARKYKNCAKGTSFTATAYLKSYGKGIEFIVDEILDEEQETKLMKEI